MLPDSYVGECVRVIRSLRGHRNDRPGDAVGDPVQDHQPRLERDLRHRRV